MLRITTLLLAAALAVNAQTPQPQQPRRCDLLISVDGVQSKADSWEPNEFRVPQGNLCKQYTYDAGWDEQMDLKLGEGAEEYREWIEMAVDVWNDAIATRSYVPEIRISNERPSDYRLSRSFWEDYEAGDDVTLDQEDDENVIYFKPSASRTGPGGVAQVWQTTFFGNSIVEADIYINTEIEETFGSQVALIVPLSRYHDNVHGVYLYAHDTYLTILHELGHALGLGHIPIAGNIMSYERWEGIREQWEAPMALHMHMLHRYSGLDNIGHDFFVDRHDHATRVWMPITDDRTRILTNFYTSKLRLGAQEKMMLACIYEF